MKGRKKEFNALKHGCYMDIAKRKIDGRTYLAKWLKSLREELISDLGGSVSRAQAILIDRIKFKVANIHFFEQAMARGEARDTKSYIALTNSLRMDLQALGFERKQKDYISYLDEVKSK